MEENAKNEMNRYNKILGVMSELDYIQKSDKTVNGQYRFVSHDQVTAKVHPLLVKYRILALPTVEELKQEGNRTEAKVRLFFVNADKPEESINVVYHGYGVDNGDKGPGKAVSYAVKYGFLKVFCLETGDDPDFDAEAAYEPAKCLEFDSTMPADVNKKKLDLFLAHSATVLKKHVEDVKREAMKRPADFWAKFKEWKPTKGE